MSSVTIQINSVAALERLLGNNEEMKLQVRRSVIEAFARGFVKRIANNAMLSAKIVSLKEEAMEAARERAEYIIGARKGERYPYRIRLSDELKAEMKSIAESQLGTIVYSEIEAAIGKLNIQAMAERVVEARVKNAVAQFASTQMATIVAREMEQQLIKETK